MSHDAACDILEGRKCYSNYPIAFEYQDERGYTHKFYSEPLIEDELMYIDRPDVKAKYNEACVVWDESAISLFSRNFMDVRNRMMGLVITLIGKLEMNFYFGCQFLSLLEKNIKIQMDALVFCNDLSFKFKNLERGAVIGQAVQDISGRFTGEMFEYSGRVYHQTFHAKPFWDIYDTKATFPVLRDRARMADIREGVKGGSIDSAGEEEKEGINEAVIPHLIAELQAQGHKEMRQALIMELAKERGFVGNHGKFGVLMMRYGAKSAPDKSRSIIWYLPEEAEGQEDEEAIIR
jgi:hypothetical protein